MKRTALLILGALSAACDMPLVMISVDAPETCMTRTVSFDPSMTGTATTYDSGGPILPSTLGQELTTAFGTTIDLKDNVLDASQFDPNGDFKDLLNVNLGIKTIRMQAIDDPLTPADESTALDGIGVLRIVLQPPAGSSLPPWTIVAYDRAAQGTPSGGEIVVSGTEANLAEYAYAGQLMFDAAIDVTLPAGPYQIATEFCVQLSGDAEMSYNDAKTQFGF
jgi:hypothetical protein